MTTIKKFANNFKWLAINQIILLISGTTLSILLPRYLGTEDFGKLSFALSFGLIIVTLTGAGLDKLLIRKISREKQNTKKTFNNAMFIKITLSITLYALMTLTMHIMNWNTDLSFYIIIAYILTSSSVSMCKAVFQAQETMKYEAITTLIEKSITLILISIITILQLKLTQISLAYLIGSSIAIIFGYHTIKNVTTKQTGQLDKKTARNLFLSAIPFFAMYISGSINLNIDVVMIKTALGNTFAGLYAASQQLVTKLFIIPTLFTATIFPAMSVFSQTGIEDLKKVYNTGLKFLLVASLPIATGTMLLNDRIVHLFYGSNFASSAPVLGLTIWLIIPYFFSALLLNLLVVIDKQNVVAISVSAGAVLNVILNLFLIQRFGIIGAAITTLITQTLICLVHFGIVYKKGYPFMSLDCVKPVIAVIVMGLVVFALHDENMVLIVLSAISSYALVLLLLRAFSEEELSIMKSTVRGLT